MNRLINQQRDCSVYTVGWLCANTAEANVSRRFLDEEYVPPPPQPKDGNGYIVGRMGYHYLVIAFPLVDSSSPVVLAHTVAHMTRTFFNVRFGLMVGTGGGAPSASHPTNPLNDIRLGDVVVSQPNQAHCGLLQYDKGRWNGDGKFEIRSYLDRPPRLLLGAMAALQSDRQLGVDRMMDYFQTAATKYSKSASPEFRFPGRGLDRLYRSSNLHKGQEGSDCSACGTAALQHRLERQSNHPAVHYGLIASGNADMRSAAHRDRLRDTWGICCFEMEAAGLGNRFPCVVIRGIVNYSDDHKNDRWQDYSTATAAAYAKDLLRHVQPEEVLSSQVASRIT